LSWILDNGSSRITIRTDGIRSITCNFNDFVRAAPTISKFSDSTQFCIAGNLDAGCDEITDTKVDNGARFVGTFMMDSTTFFSEEAKDSFNSRIAKILSAVHTSEHPLVEWQTSQVSSAVDILPADVSKILSIKIASSYKQKTFTFGFRICTTGTTLKTIL
jgi:hypothetical protein